MSAKTRFLRDSAALRWMTLILISLTMFAVYLVNDEFSPLKTFLEVHNSWDSVAYGWFQSSYSLFNVFLFMLIIGGLVLDKIGARATGIASCIVCVAGIAVKYWAMASPALAADPAPVHFFGNVLPKPVFWASMGFALFGVGAEVAGVTVTKSIAKWFKGYEMALAMGLQVAIARLGSGAALAVSPIIAGHFGTATAVVLTGLILMALGTLLYIIFAFYDKKLDTQLDAAGESEIATDEDKFSWKDILCVLKNPAFWMIAVLCVLFYSAVFPFLKYASDLMVNKFGVSEQLAGFIPSILPFGCIILTPLFGGIYDKKGHGADLMILGALIIAAVHVLFAMPFINRTWQALLLMVALGIGFALLPSAMWPSVAKIIPARQLGTAMSLTFYIQNIGLWGVPLLIGSVLDKYCITGQVQVSGDLVRNTYNYTLPSVIFSAFGIVSIFIAAGVKVLDRKKGYGLQDPNIEA